MTDSTVKRNRRSLDTLLGLATWKYGYLTSKQSVHAGVSQRSLQNHFRNGRIERVARGAYRFTQLPLDLKSQEREFMLAAGENAVLSHESALAIHGLSDIIPNQVHITLPRTERWKAASRMLRNPLVRVHYVSKPIDAVDIETVDGFRLTGPARTIVDCIETYSAPEQIEAALREAKERRPVRESDLWRVADARRSHVRNWLRSHFDGMRGRGI